MKVEQVKFKEVGDDRYLGGILIDDRYLICGCCGSVFDLTDGDQADDIEFCKSYPDWVDISHEILGE